jgi:hypothetical protein
MYWSLSTEYGSAGIWLTDPVDVHEWELSFPSMDTCIDPDASTFTVPAVWGYGFDDSTLQLSNELGRTIDLTWDGISYSYQNDDLDSSDYFASHSYSLRDVSDPDAPSLEVENFIQTPEFIEVTTPDFTGFSPPNVRRDQAFTWTRGTGDYVWIIGIKWNAAYTAVEQRIQCIANDDGRFSIPFSAWDSWATGRMVYFYIGHGNESGAEIWYNGSESRVSAMSYILGAAYAN